MLLEALYRLHDRLEKDERYGLPRSGRSIQKIGIIVVLRPDGTLVNLELLEKPRPVEVLGITKPSGSGINPCFLWDSTLYALAWVKEGIAKREEELVRAQKTFERFREYHWKVRQEIRVPAYEAVCAFLEDWSQEKALAHPALQEYGTGFVVFQVRGETQFVHQDPRIQEWWDRRTGGDPEHMKAWWNAKANIEGVTGTCLVTGRNGRLARLHDKIKGVAGAQSSGAALVAFNRAAFKSYGLSQSFNAPVAEDVARKCVLSLNALLSGPLRGRHRVVVGDVTAVFWTEEETDMEDVFAAIVGDPAWKGEESQAPATLARVREVLEARRQGRDAGGSLPLGERFHLVGLGAPTPARVAVRFHVTGSLQVLLRHLRSHLRDTQMERERRRKESFLSLKMLAKAPAGPKETVAAPLLSGLFEAVFSGRRYPDGLYRKVLDRLRTESSARGPGVDWPRAAMIRAYLVRNRGKEVPMTLDKDRPDVPYRLGRLFAALEKTQQDALGKGIGATIRDRFYGSASVTPAVVFPRLLRVYQHHLAKLEGGRKINREKLVQEILDGVDAFPRHLDLDGQGMFALGYYHQKNDLYRVRTDDAETAGAGEED